MEQIKNIISKIVCFIPQLITIKINESLTELTHLGDSLQEYSLDRSHALTQSSQSYSNSLQVMLDSFFNKL